MKFLVLFFICFFCNICNATDLHQDVLMKINKIRNGRGLSTLRVNAKLNFAAQSQTDWMAQVQNLSHLRHAPTSFEEYKNGNYHPINRVINSGYFSFDKFFRVEYNPDGSGVAVHPNPETNNSIGEIIARGAGNADAFRPDIIVSGWMNSPGHRETILTPGFQEFGVGITSIRPNEVYWCVVFTKR